MVIQHIRKMAIQVQNPMLKVNYFLLKNPKLVMSGNRGSNRHDICGSPMIIHDDDDEGAKQGTKFGHFCILYPLSPDCNATSGNL